MTSEVQLLATRRMSGGVWGRGRVCVEGVAGRGSMSNLLLIYSFDYIVSGLNHNDYYCYFNLRMYFYFGVVCSFCWH